jgi:dTDP-4-dehydrorhamnose reductase
MTEKPFVHKEAYVNVKSNFIFQDQFAKLFLKIINKKGVYNIGGKSQSIYNFAKSTKIILKKKYQKESFRLNKI